MKKSILLVSLISLTLSACVKPLPRKMQIDAESAKESFNKKISIFPLDDSVIISGKDISIEPREENTVYTISGYFDGQIKVKTKNTVIKLKNAYLENSSGKPAITSEAKMELSSVKDSENYIVSRGRSLLKRAAAQSKRGLVLGGSGTMYIKGSVCHGVEAEEVKIKGSGNLFVEGSQRGSAFSCEDFAVEPEKSFSAYILNSKNGIKADRTISIKSGFFHLYSNGTALKTDTRHESPKFAHIITLEGGKFYTYQNGCLYETDTFLNNATIEEIEG